MARSRRAPATASSPDGPARRGAPAARRALDRDEEGVGGVGAGRARREHQVDELAAGHVRRGEHVRPLGIVLDVADRRDLRAEALDLGRDARLEALARDAADRLLDDDPDRERTNGATQTIGVLPKPAMRAPARPCPGTTCGATLTLATRSPFSTTWPSNAVKTSSGSIRLSRSSSATSDVEDAVCAASRSTRLCTGRGGSARARRPHRPAGARHRPRAARRLRGRGP